MYTAWLWLRWSVHADTPASSSDTTSNRLIMIAPVLPESRAAAGGPRRRRLAVSHRLDHALDEQRQHDRDVVQGRKKPRTICAVGGMSLSRGSGGAACAVASD